MSKFSLQGLGTPKSASYDNESAYKELLSRMDKGERLTIEVYTDKDGYSSFGIQTGVVSKFKLRLNQDILLKIMQYLTNNETEDVKCLMEKARTSQWTCSSLWSIMGSNHRPFPCLEQSMARSNRYSISPKDG